VPTLGGHVIEAAPMTPWPGLQTDKLVGDEQVALPLQCQMCCPESFQMGAANTKFLYKVTNSYLYIKRKEKRVNVRLKVFLHY